MDYKNLSANPCIYRLHQNGRSYVGATNNLRTRIVRHLSYLRRNAHSNHFLQSAFDKNPKFTVEVLKSMEIDDSADLFKHYEHMYHIKYDSVENGFNYELPRLKQKAFKLTEEQIKKAVLKSSKPVMCFCRFTGEFIKTYNSISDAAKSIGDQTTNISRVCKGTLNYCKNYVFIYKQNYNSDADYSFKENSKKGRVLSKEVRKNMRLANAKARKVYKYDEGNKLVAEYISIRECERVHEMKKDSLRTLIKKGNVVNGHLFTHNKH